MIVKKCRPWPDAASEDAAAGLGLHFLHMSEGPFSHDAGQMIYDKGGLRKKNREEKEKEKESEEEEKKEEEEEGFSAAGSK